MNISPVHEYVTKKNIIKWINKISFLTQFCESASCLIGVAAFLLTVAIGTHLYVFYYPL